MSEKGVGKEAISRTASVMAPDEKPPTQQRELEQPPTEHAAATPDTKAYRIDNSVVQQGQKGGGGLGADEGPEESLPHDSTTIPAAAKEKRASYGPIEYTKEDSGATNTNRRKLPDQQSNRIETKKENRIRPDNVGLDPSNVPTSNENTESPLEDSAAMSSLRVENDANQPSFARQQRVTELDRLRPGAYEGIPGQNPRRLASFAFSLLGGGGAHSRWGSSSNSNTNDGPQGGAATSSRMTSALAPEDDRGLAQARPVQETGTPDIEASPYDSEAMERKRSQAKKRLQFCLSGLVLLLLVVLICVGVLLRVFRKVNDPEEAHLAPSSLPSEAPSGFPSFAPTGVLDLLLDGLEEYTLENLKNISTPQWQAYDWLSRHPDLPEMTESRKRQLFALSTFFYAMEGPKWHEDARNNWLQYSDECYWFSSSFGTFVESGQWVEQDWYGQPCNKDGDFQVIDLEKLGISKSSNAFVPAEISMLTGLTHLSLRDNGIRVPLSEFLPSQLYQMTTLSLLTLWFNEFSGQIPSEIGLLSGLRTLHLDWNMYLTGTIPTQVGLLSNITFFSCTYSAMTGTIPTEAGLMTSMTSLWIAGHRGIGGTIPTELSKLSNISEVWIAENSLYGDVPSELGLLTKMTGLWIEDNQLTGVIPSELGLLTSTTELISKINDLTGPIPTELGMLTNLWKLQLHENQLSGLIPSELSLMRRTKELYLRSNKLTGSIPSQLGLLTRARVLDLSDNSLLGSIPMELDALACSLSRLNLEKNTLTGRVSDDLCQLGPWQADAWQGFSFDCNNSTMCGCGWCACSSGEEEEGHSFKNDTTTKNHQRCTTFTGTGEEVTVACDGQCCVGTDACVWSWIKTVSVGSCLGDYSCYKQGATFIGSGCCTGTSACRESQAHTIEDNSCNGNASCYDLNAQGIQQNSCNGWQACYLTDSRNMEWLTGCNGSSACEAAFFRR